MTTPAFLGSTGPAIQRNPLATIGVNWHAGGKPPDLLLPDILRLLKAAGPKGIRANDLAPLCDSPEDVKSAHQCLRDLIASGRAVILDQEGATIPRGVDRVALAPDPEPKAATPESPAPAGKRGRR